jgi:hypothetical protein
MKVDFSSINYIANGNPINQTTLNKPSVSLETRTDELRRASLSNSDELSILSSLVFNASTGSASVISNENWAIKITGHLDKYSVQDSEREISYSVALQVGDFEQSVINISSATENFGKYTITHDDLSSVFGGYGASKKSYRLKNNGDSICIKVPRQHSLTVDTGLKSAKQLYSYGNYDTTFSQENSNSFELVKLPLLNTLELKTGLSLTSLNTYLATASSNAYKILVSNTNEVTLVDIATEQEILNSSIVVSIDGSDNYEISKITIDSSNIKYLELASSVDNLPQDYDNSSASSGRSITIKYKVSSTVTNIYTFSSSTIVPIQSLDEDYVYIPLVVKTPGSIKFSGGLGEVPISNFSALLDSGYQDSTYTNYLTNTGLNWGIQKNSIIKYKMSLPSSVYYKDYRNVNLAAYKSLVDESATIKLSEVRIESKIAHSVTSGTANICVRDSLNNRYIVKVFDNSVSSITSSNSIDSAAGILDPTFIYVDLCNSSTEEGIRGTGVGQISDGVVTSGAIHSIDLVFTISVE